MFLGACAFEDILVEHPVVAPREPVDDGTSPFNECHPSAEHSDEACNVRESSADLVHGKESK